MNKKVLKTMIALVIVFLFADTALRYGEKLATYYYDIVEGM